MGSFWLVGACLFLVLVVIGVATAAGGGKLLFTHRRRAEFMLEECNQVTNDAIIQLDRAFVLGERTGVGAEAGDDVITRLAASDRVGKLPSAPVVELKVFRVADQTVEAAELLIDGGVLERRVEDIDRLVLTRHALAILPLVVTAPRWLPEREEGKCRPRRDAAEMKFE